MTTAIDLFKKYRDTCYHHGGERYWFHDIEEVAKNFHGDYQHVLDMLKEYTAEAVHDETDEDRELTADLLAMCEKDKAQMESIKANYLDGIVDGHRGYYITRVEDGVEECWYAGKIVFVSRDVEEAGLAVDFLNAHAFITETKNDLDDQIISDVEISIPANDDAGEQTLRVREIPTAHNFTFSLAVKNGNDCASYFEFPKDSPPLLTEAVRKLQEAMVDAAERPGLSGKYRHGDR